MEPKVSICIPAYKQIKFLRKNLTSIASQTFDNYEIILADDSPDNAVELLLKEFHFGDKIKYFRNSPALGSPENWNFAIKKACGEYIKIMHHDDFFTSNNSLKKYIDLLDANPHADFAFSATEILLLESETKKAHFCKQKDLAAIIRFPEKLVVKNVIGAPSATIFRRRNTVFFDSKLKWLVDIDWYIAFIKSNNKIIYSNEKLICTIHGAVGQITQSVQQDKNVQIKEHIHMLEKYRGMADNEELFVLFQLLFHKYEIKTLEDIRKIVDFDADLDGYFQKVCIEKDKNIFIKKAKYWFKRYSLNDYISLIRKKIK
jgi:glycosyltransferase involved in cell wall biosynthesis